jgi:hypothetical protein
MSGTSGNGSEIDSHINKLQGMIGKGAGPEIKKSLDAIISLRKAEKQAEELKKSHAAIGGIAKALHTPSFKIGIQAGHNMSESAKASLSDHHKIVNKIMKAWSEEEKKAASDISNILNVEGILGK